MVELRPNSAHAELHPAPKTSPTGFPIAAPPPPPRPDWLPAEQQSSPPRQRPKLDLTLARGALGMLTGHLSKAKKDLTKDRDVIQRQKDNTLKAEQKWDF